MVRTFTLGMLMVAVFLPGKPGKSAEPPEPGKAPLTVIDAAGKEHKLKTWKFTAGTRRLDWLAPPAAKEPAEPKKDHRSATGPEALAFREDNSTNPPYVNGIVTLILLDHLASLDFDAEKRSVTATVAMAAEPDHTLMLKGPTRFKDVNRVVLEAEADLGELGVAEIKFLGGGAKDSIRSIRFPAAKGAPLGTYPVTIIANDKEKTSHSVAEPQPLYRRPDGSHVVLPALHFKKTLKLDLAKVRTLRAVEGKEGDGRDWHVTLRDGTEHTLTLLTAIEHENQPLTLVGLAARVPAGYKIFPPTTLGEVRLPEEKKPE